MYKICHFIDTISRIV